MYNINRRKFLGLFGCGCCSIILPSCSTVPITERKQLSIIPEATINRKLLQLMNNLEVKLNLITKWFSIKRNKEIGKKMENSVSAFFNSKKKILQKILNGIIY